MKRALPLYALAGALLAAPALASEPAPVPGREVAHAAYVAGNYTKSRQILQTLLADAPDDADLHRRLAMVEAASGDHGAALVSIDRALSLAPQNGDVQLARGYILLWSDRLEEARLHAGVLSASHPDYPGLSDLLASLERADRSRALTLRFVHAGTSLSEASFESGRNSTWFTQRAGAAFGWATNVVGSLEIEREERDQTDTQLRGRIDLPVASDRVFFAASVTPDAAFRSNWSIGAGSEITRGEDGAFLVDASYAEYERDDVVALGAGYRHRFTPTLTASARTIHMFGGGEDYRLGAAVRADYTSRDMPDLFAVVASYPDTESDGTRQLRAIAGGAMIALSESLELRIVGEFESREASYERTAIGLDLRWHIGAR